MKLTRTAVHATHSWVNNDRALADFTAALETGACNSKDGFLCLPELGERLVRRRFRAESYGDNWGSGLLSVGFRTVGAATPTPKSGA